MIYPSRTFAASSEISFQSDGSTWEAQASGISPALAAIMPPSRMAREQLSPPARMLERMALSYVPESLLCWRHVITT